MLTSAARETLRGVDTVIVDEIHALAGTKRGAHLALSLERLDELTAAPVQRIGLSATVRPHDEVARFLGGTEPVTIVAPPSGKRFDLTVRVPVDDLSDLAGRDRAAGRCGRTSRRRSSTRCSRTAPRSCSRTPGGSPSGSPRASTSSGPSAPPSPRWSAPTASRARGRMPRPSPSSRPPRPPGRPPADLPGASGITAGAEPVIARSHHGSVSKEERALVEDDLKSGRLRCVVATSSLELGIDMGAVDLVMQVESPPSVASGLQRVGRAGHQVGEVSTGRHLPEAPCRPAALGGRRRAHDGGRDRGAPHPGESARRARAADGGRRRARRMGRRAVVRRRAPRRAVRTRCRARRSTRRSTCSPGATPPTASASCARASSGTATPAPSPAGAGAQRLAVTSGGTIPDRGLFGVFMVGDAGRRGARVGELDEEMVYESRVGDVFALGATSWRIQEITHDRVLVSPAFGEPGRLPFWKGDGIGRPAELGAAIGGFIGELAAAEASDALDRCRARGSTSARAANLVAFIADQRDGDRVVPDATNLVVERFRDELGDWRVVLHSPVRHAGARAVGARHRAPACANGSASTANAVASDDGIVLRMPDTGERAARCRAVRVRARRARRSSSPSDVGGSALFASRFRECAARALLLPRHEPRHGARRSGSSGSGPSQLLEVARDYPDFPIVLEAVRECLQDVYDLPGARRGSPSASQLARRCDSSRSTTDAPSPFARDLLFGYVGAFMYEGDAPLAERRAAALSLDPTLLAELLGTRRAARAARPGGRRRSRARAAAPRPRPAGARRRGRGRPAARCSAR